MQIYIHVFSCILTRHLTIFYRICVTFLLLKIFSLLSKAWYSILNVTCLFFYFFYLFRSLRTSWFCRSLASYLIIHWNINNLQESLLLCKHHSFVGKSMTTFGFIKASITSVGLLPSCPECFGFKDYLLYSSHLYSWFFDLCGSTAWTREVIRSFSFAIDGIKERQCKVMNLSFWARARKIC